MHMTYCVSTFKGPTLFDLALNSILISHNTVLFQSEPSSIVSFSIIYLIVSHFLYPWPNNKKGVLNLGHITTE